MYDMQYSVMVDLIQAMLQSWGSSFENNAIKQIIEHVSLPQVARTYPWRKITKNYNKTLTVDTDTYALPYDFDKFWSVKSKYGEFTELTPVDFHRRFPDRTDRKVRDIGFFTVEEFQGVQAQIDTAELVTVVSSDTGDTATVLVRGEVGGYDDYEEITLNGTTAVSSTKTFTSVSHVSKSAITTGIVTLTGATSGTALTKIPAEHLTAQYKRMVLSDAPQEALELVGTYLTQIFRPLRDYDTFKVPPDLVFLHALSLLSWERRNVTEQLALEKKYKEELAMAIKYDRKSYNIRSRMESANESRKVIPNDYPLINNM